MSAMKSLSASRQLRTTVLARAATKNVAPKAAPPPPKAPKSSNNLSVLAKIADLGLLSKVEELKLLSKVEEAGLLSYVENAGLLSYAEKSGLLKFVADPSTPSSLSSVGFFLIAAAAATAYHLSDNISIDVVSAIVALLGLTAIIGGSVLDKIQKL